MTIKNIKERVVARLEGKCECEFRDLTKPCCRKQDPDRMFICTRPEGHSGKHIACGDVAHRIAEWG